MKINPILCAGNAEGGGYPNYTQLIKIPLNTTYTCPDDGWVVVLRLYSPSSGGGVSINGSSVLWVTAKTYACGGIYPVKKGDIVRTSNISTDTDICKLGFLYNRD